MIIVKKPFMYLKDMFEWRYRQYHDKPHFISPERIMVFENREDMTCRIFQNKDTKRTTKDAKYKVITLLDFFGNSILNSKDCVRCRYSKAYYFLPFIKLGLKVVKNAEIVIPTTNNFPLIIRNDKYNFYIAPREVEITEEQTYLVKEE